MVVSAGWGIGLALATSLVSGAAYFYFHLGHGGATGADDFIALAVFLPIALVANVLGWLARMRAAEAEDRRREADRSALLAKTLAHQQAALRRTATLVARGVSPAQIYPAAFAELCRGLSVESVVLLRYTPLGDLVVVDARDPHNDLTMPGGKLLPELEANLSALVLCDGRPHRMDYVPAPASTADRVGAKAIRFAVGTPVVVAGTVWGALIAGSSRPIPLPSNTELRLADFADLVATAIANASTRAELNASRARIVAAADHAWQLFERDLHDGAQQHVVSLGLRLRGIESKLRPDQDDLRQEVSLITAGLHAVAVELRELSQGMHPSILSTRGLSAAINRLARRSAIPVTLDLRVKGRMPEPVEVASYYVAAEALANAAKHARATEVTVRARIRDDTLYLTFRDNGIGGADVGRGSGLIGLRDRVEVLGGQLEISSPDGFGTILAVAIPMVASPR